MPLPHTGKVLPVFQSGVLGPGKGPADTVFFLCLQAAGCFLTLKLKPEAALSHQPTASLGELKCVLGEGWAPSSG